MDIFQISLVLAAVITALLVSNDRRALIWIGVAAANFIACTLYQDSGLTIPPYPLFVGLMDATVCLALYIWGHLRWEMLLFRLFQLSVLISILRLSRIIDTNYVYVTALELVNWLALAVIGGAQLLRWAGHGRLGNIGAATFGNLRGAGLALFKERKRQPFHRG